MSFSLLRWSIALIFFCLLAPPAFAAEPERRTASKPSKKPAAKKRLVRIPGGKRLRHDAAAAFGRMYTEARAEGVRLWVISGHRSWRQQRYLYRLYRKGLGPRAARPGRSNHQRGTAVDVSVGDESTPTYEWLAANACRFGFKRTVSSEPWHWEYRPRATQAPAPGVDCLGQPLEPAEPPAAVAGPDPS
ncbi:M15 family metallopeptidase [Hyalangium rubrum]|uniref:M15 family metallopeptidase n=1 Tax=Hyalangium rubrum TaxID=3103134 RepID=A0ABU5GVQ8_9BACT|nr:M15 family metallopeptidase [Hyalangium sp. s54d21]MDY7225272.1 M15 family metallopeptidase [Hyalangium sp. s54d21]